MSVDLYKELPPVCVVWSAYGHWFGGSMGYDTPDHPHSSYEECITCGARYILRNLGGMSGEYLTADGSEPMECSDITDRAAHGPERHCDHDNGRSCPAFTDEGTCEHTDYECNCVLCD